MGYPYHFVSIDAEQEARRRQLLNSYGQFAQLSILLLPLSYQLGLGVRLLLSRLQRHNVYKPIKEHQNPIASGFTQPVDGISGNLWARLRWALDEQAAEGWGTRGQWLAATVWTGWLVLLAVKDTEDDYLHVTRRFGIIAASQLPLHYALALKSWSPIQYLTRLSHEELNPYHRLLGRIIITLMVCHATLYLNFYVQKGLLLKRVQDRDVILGLTAISTTLLLGTAALQRIRNWNYRVFFYLHVILSITLLPVLYFHVSYLRAYIVESAFIYALLIAQRNTSQFATNADIKLLPNTNLLSITLPLSKSLSSRSFAPGQHIYLSFPSLPQKLRINPFSVANAYPTEDKELHLLARALHGTTALLAHLAKTHQHQPIPLLIEGPYGSAIYFPDLCSFDRILFVAGGVGATFTLPIYQDLMRRSERSREGVLGAKFVWSVRSMADAHWAIPQLHSQNQGTFSPNEFEIYITRKSDNGPPPGVFGISESIELQEREGLLDESSTPEAAAKIAELVRRGRPNLRLIVDELFSHNMNDRVAVLVCGPTGMGAAVRKEVGRWVARGRDVYWHSEEFGW